MIVFTVLSVLLGIHAGFTGETYSWYLFLLISCMIVPVSIFRYWLVKTHRVTDWDIRKRAQRIKPLIALVVFILFDIVVVSTAGSSILTNTFILFALWLFGLLLITFFTKISGHVSAVTLAVLLIISWFGWQLLPLLCCVPLVGWARVVGKNHTLGQVVVGVVYSTVVLYISYILHLI